MVTHHRHEDLSKMLRTGFIRYLFSLIIRFFHYLRVQFGFDYLFGPSCLYQFLRSYFDWTIHEFRNVVDSKKCFVSFRVLLWQNKWFAEIAVGIKMTEI